MPRLRSQDQAHTWRKELQVDVDNHDDELEAGVAGLKVVSRSSIINNACFSRVLLFGQPQRQERPCSSLTPKLQRSKGLSAPGAHNMPRSRPSVLHEKRVRGAKLYLRLVGQLGIHETSSDVPSYCHPYVPASGCVRVEVLKAFLRGKWIPAKETLPPRALHDLELPLPPHHYHRHTASTIGHLFEPADSDEYILNDFLLYLLTRPEKAVPPPVRELLLPKAFRHSWPGDVPGRDSFKPPRKDCGLREKDSCHLLAMQYQEADTEDFTSHACNEICSNAAIFEAFSATIDNATRGERYRTVHKAAPLDFSRTMTEKLDADFAKARNFHTMSNIAVSFSGILLMLVYALVVLVVLPKCGQHIYYRIWGAKHNAEQEEEEDASMRMFSSWEKRKRVEAHGDIRFLK
ncbi:hypothetical protein CYMTET_49789 [Cymbomonas tetramitiformis]|uniref:Uncharacterized protein n=1 Tax=Cymbomonas tetramitiformis TaxID=36881 RepID=A0AAE0ETT1_9CHLO|nr:hypothetical protein CYMTET_49789 [Cymbomonas tetramitiformis]